MAKSFSTERGASLDPERYRYLQTALVGYEQTIENTRQESSRITREAAQEQGKNWRAAVDSLSSYNDALNSGSAGAAIKALADLSIAAKAGTPTNEGMLGEIGAYARGQYPGAGTDEQGRTATEVNRVAWQVFTSRMANPGSNEQTLGNYDAMVRDYGVPTDAMFSADSTERYKLGQIQKAAEEQRQYQQKAQGKIDDALGASAEAKKFLDAKGGTVSEDEARSFLKATASAVRSSVNVKEMLAYSKKNADRPVELTGQSKIDHENLEKQAKEAEAIRDDLLKQQSSNSDRDNMAILLNMPKFQAWAESNGFHVGHIEPLKPGETAEDNEWLTPVGRYVPGPDDHKALALNRAQLGKRPDSFHPFMHNAVKTTPTYGTVEIKRPGASVPDESYKAPDGNYYYTTDGAGKHTYLTPEKAVEAAKTQEVHADTTGPRKQLTETIRGKFGSMWAGAPVGSVVINGTTYTPDQLAGEPVVTSGGKDRPLKAFVKEYTARRNANVQTRQDNALVNEKEPFNAASWAAQTLTPRVVPQAEKDADAARADAASVAKQAQARTASEVADATGRDVKSVGDILRMKNESNPYVQTEHDQMLEDQAALAKLAGDQVRARNSSQKGLPEEFQTPGKYVDPPAPRPEGVPDVTPVPDQRAAFVKRAPPSSHQAGAVINAVPTSTFTRPGPAAPTAPVEFKEPKPFAEQGLPYSSTRLPATAESGPLSQRHEYMVKTGRDMVNAPYETRNVATELRDIQDKKNADRLTPWATASADQRARLLRDAKRAEKKGEASPADMP